MSTVNVRGQRPGAARPLGLQFRFAAGRQLHRDLDRRSGHPDEPTWPPGTSLQGTVINGVCRSVQDDATFGWYVEPSLSHKRFWLSSGLRLDGGSSYGSGVDAAEVPQAELLLSPLG